MFHEVSVSPAKNSYSILVENGLIFCFQEIDIGLGPFSISADRIRVVDFLHPINYESFAMIMKKPSGSIASSALLVFKPYAGMNQFFFCGVTDFPLFDSSVMSGGDFKSFWPVFWHLHTDLLAHNHYF